jgi:periplasmic divalent cation tolerance protein
VVLCTAPRDGARGKLGAEALARRLVEERLCACVNVLPGVRSVFRWQGAVDVADEHLLVLKTTAAGAARLRARVLELHPYEVPEVLELPVAGGSEPYLRWLTGSVASVRGSGRRAANARPVRDDDAPPGARSTAHSAGQAPRTPRARPAPRPKPPQGPKPPPGSKRSQRTSPVPRTKPAQRTEPRTSPKPAPRTQAAPRPEPAPRTQAAPHTNPAQGTKARPFANPASRAQPTSRPAPVSAQGAAGADRVPSAEPTSRAHRTHRAAPALRGRGRR